MKVQAQPADYAAALQQAMRETPADQPAALAEGFLRVLEEDGMLPRWREVAAELAARAIPRSLAVARAADAERVRETLGPGADITVDPGLIAGAVIRRGDTLVDGSIAGHFRRLARLLGESA